MLNIFVARHGQNEDNVNHVLNGHRDLPLTEIGVNQAHGLADGIEELNLTFDAVYCSPLSRASKTAEIVCATLGLGGPIILEELIERDFGTMTGKSIDDIERLCAPKILKADVITYFLEPVDGETFPQALERAHVALDKVRAAHTSGSILLVTHGDIGKMLYAAYYEHEWEYMLTHLHFGNCELLHLAEDVDPDKRHALKIEQHNH
jgi:broad specificity phosphatase PhoE